MASETRVETNALTLFDGLQQAPYRYDFFEILRRLECAFNDDPRLGTSLHAGLESIRLAQDPSMAFAPSTLASFVHRSDSRPPRLGVSFFGLLGPNGPLPLHLTEYVYDRLHNTRDTTLVAFLDLFHHRLLTLFYRAWANSQPTVSFDRPNDDRFGDYLACLFGIGTEALQSRDAMPDLAKLYYAGRLAAQTRNREGLEAMLRDFFALPVRIEEYIGEWIDIPDDCICRLGKSEETGTLGLTALLGESAWQCQQKFRIVIGKVNYGDYQRLLPGGDSLKRLVALVRNYVGDELSWELHLILEEPEVPCIRLDGSNRLGWTTWLTQASLGRDGDDLILNPGEFGGIQ